MPTINDLKHEYRTVAIQAHELVKDDSVAGPEKREQLDRMDEQLKSLSDQLAEAEHLAAQEAKYASIVGGVAAAEPEPTPEPVEAKSVGEQVTSSAEFQRILAVVGKSSSFHSGPIDVKATLTQSGLTSANAIAQDRRPGILPILFERLTVADLMPNGATDSNTVRYAKESTATNAASSVAEGAAKPEATLNFTVVDEPVRKIAVTLKVSDEMLEDVPQLQAYINGRLTLFVRLHEEAQLLNGNGTAPDLTGILNRSGLTAAQALGGDSIAVAVHKEVTKVRVASFLDPDALVFHPNDWQAARLEQDANDQFYGGGPFTGPYGINGVAGDSYWGLRVVSTTAMTENTVLVGAFATAAQIFRRSGITVEMTNSNEDDFKKNLVAVRAEERLALAIYRPAAFGTVTGV